VQEIHLDRDGLELRLEVHSAVQPFPASVGWHPWFRRDLERGEELELEFAAASMYECGVEGIPTGRLIPPSARPWDDCFTDLERPPVLTWPGALQLTIESPETHCVVYDEPEHAICVEPMTGPPNALNLAPRLVTPGEPLVARMRMSWERL
jgi:aldose 1-epimerase